MHSKLTQTYLLLLKNSIKYYIEREATYTCKSSIQTYNITIESITNGTVTGDSLTGVISGESRILTITPNTNYMIDKVLVNGVDKTNEVTDNQLTITANENKNVKVSFKKIPFKLTINNVEGATITPNGVIDIESGDNKDVTITANYGYKLISVKVNDVEKITDMSGDTLTLSSITENTIVKVEVAKITYNVVDGKNQNLDLKNGITSFVVKADGEYSDFSNLLIDDEEVSGTLYDVTEGSTIATFNEDGIKLLKGLNKGQHTLTFVYEDGGVATTNFTITDSTKTNNPQTGDNVTLFIALELISLIGFGSTVFVLKRKKTTA